MAADFPTSIADFLSYIPAAGKAIPYDVFQNLMDEILAIETVLGAGSVGGTSFTPTIVSAGGGTPTYSLQVGRYRRFCGLVQVTGRVTLATFGTLAAGAILIGGLPVTSVNTADLFGSAVIPYWSNLTTAATNVTGYVPNNGSAIQLNLVAAAVTTVAALTKADLTGTSGFVFSGIYPAS